MQTSFSSFGCKHVNQSALHMKGGKKQIFKIIKTLNHALEEEIKISDSSSDNSDPESDITDTDKDKTQQSQFKNKLKEVLESAKGILQDLCKFKDCKSFQRVELEAQKSDAEWTRDGEILKANVETFKDQAQKIFKLEKKMLKNLPKGEKKRLKNILQKEKEVLKQRKEPLLARLVDKRYYLFIGLFQFKNEIESLINSSDIVEKFSDQKDKISLRYFETNKFDNEEDLFCWILLAKIAMVFIPQDKNFINILPITKKNVYFNYWMIRSKMKEINKHLCKQYEIRKHILGTLDKVYWNLKAQGKKLLSESNRKLLQNLENSLDEGKDERNQLNRKRAFEETHNINSEDFEDEEKLKKLTCTEEILASYSQLEKL